MKRIHVLLLGPVLLIVVSSSFSRGRLDEEPAPLKFKRFPDFGNMPSAISPTVTESHR